MNYQEQEEFDAWVSRNDRFDGFDRGDSYEYVSPEKNATPDDDWEDIPF
jgi:hypothetical protein